MNFNEIANARQSCRNFDKTRSVEKEKIDAIMEAARLAPSACNGQPYFFTVCIGENAKKVAKCTQSVGMNKFTDNASVMIVISEKPYVKTAKIGSALKKIDYRSIDIGIAAAYITAQAESLGVGSCILGWLDDEKIRKVCNTDSKTHLVIALGYPNENDKLRTKIRKDMDELVKFI